MADLKVSSAIGPAPGTVIIRMQSFVLSSSALDPPVQLQKVLIQRQTGVEKRHQGVRQNLVHLDQRADDAVETAMLHGLRQANTEDFTTARALRWQSPSSS